MERWKERCRPFPVNAERCRSFPVNADMSVQDFNYFGIN